MRFVPPVAGLATGAVDFDGDPHMRLRPVGEVLDALRTLGVDVEGTGLPFTVHGTGRVRGGTVVVDASASSQFVSALLLAGARFDEGVDVRHDGRSPDSGGAVAPPHRDDGRDAARARCRGRRLRRQPLGGRARPDPCGRPDHRARPVQRRAVPRAGRRQRWRGDGPRLAARHHPGGRRAARASSAPWAARSTHVEAGLRVRGTGRLQGVDLDLHDVGELTPAVAALCALAESPSHLRGIGHIRGHETDRLAALARELGGLGADVTEHADGLSFRPGAAPRRRVPHLRRPPDGPRRRHRRRRGRRRPGRGRRHHVQDVPRLRRLLGGAPVGCRAAATPTTTTSTTSVRDGAPARAPRSARPTTTRSTGSS